jgi:flagellar biosynthesis protein FliQ
MFNVQGAFKMLVGALVLPFVGVLLISIFATGTTVGEMNIKNFGPTLLWLIPVFAIIGIFIGLLGKSLQD